MPPEEEHRVELHLDRLLAAHGLTLTELAERVGVTLANLSVLKNGRARAIRFSTLTALCDALDCQPGDLLTVRPGSDEQQERLLDLGATSRRVRNLGARDLEASPLQNGE
jgi:putative transcriptional regulator